MTKPLVFTTPFTMKPFFSMTSWGECLNRLKSDFLSLIVYYSTGKRFFGKYQAVIHVQISNDGEEKSRYVAAVYAYPENCSSRFFARHLGLVDHFFPARPTK